MVFAIFCIVNMVFFAVALIAGSATTSAAMKVFRGTERNMGGDITQPRGLPRMQALAQTRPAQHFRAQTCRGIKSDVLDLPSVCCTAMLTSFQTAAALV